MSRQEPRLNKTWKVCEECGRDFPAKTAKICLECRNRYQKVEQYGKSKKGV